jgi:hypothetical protein
MNVLLKNLPALLRASQVGLFQIAPAPVLILNPTLLKSVLFQCSGDRSGPKTTAEHNGSAASLGQSTSPSSFLRLASTAGVRAMKSTPWRLIVSCNVPFYFRHATSVQAYTTCSGGILKPICNVLCAKPGPGIHPQWSPVAVVPNIHKYGNTWGQEEAVTSHSKHGIHNNVENWLGTVRRLYKDGAAESIWTYWDR